MIEVYHDTSWNFLVFYGSKFKVNMNQQTRKLRFESNPTDDIHSKCMVQGDIGNAQQKKYFVRIILTLATNT